MLSKEAPTLIPPVGGISKQSVNLFINGAGSIQNSTGSIQNPWGAFRMPAAYRLYDKDEAEAISLFVGKTGHWTRNSPRAFPTL